MPKLRTVIKLSIALILLTSVGVSGAKWFRLGPFEEQEKIPVSQMPRQYLDMEPLLIPLVQKGGVAAIVQITLKLETRGDENAAEISRLMPRLKDAFFNDMYSFLPRLLKDRERLDPYILKKRFAMVADKVIKPAGTVTDVLIQSLTDQPGS
ncbi:MAG: flagellar basal body-associated FliL family protein [Rhodospirillales bacterium]